MNVVGIDLSLTSTGLASYMGVQTIKSPANKINGMRRIAYIRDEIMDYLGKFVGATGLPALVALEGYSFGAKGSAIFQIGELGGVMRLTFWENAIEYVEVPPASLKKYATGKGNAPKDMVFQAAIQRSGITFTGNDEADAWWLYVMGQDGIDEPVIKVPAIHREALHKVIWTPVEVAAVASS